MNSASRLIVVASIVGLLAWFFFDALFSGGMFCFRDAAHYYYPLFKLVSDQWAAGRAPLWNPYENLGQPLAGNPTASVFYPGKLIFALPISYPWAYKTYIMAHLLLAAFAAYRLVRRWRASVEAAGVCAISYAFSGNVLFQYCNVVFLVGAAWLPMAMLAADRTLRRGRGRLKWAVLLGVVLAMMTLGGDPQMAYNAGLLATFYALLLWCAKRRSKRSVAKLSGARGLPRSGRRSYNSHRLVGSPALLALAAASGLALSAVQVLPSLEFAQRSDRAAAPVADRLLARLQQGTHSEHTYHFSVGPWRLAEFLWPNVGGRQFPVHQRWLEVIPAEGRIWTPSLYMGVLPLLLAFSAMRLRGEKRRELGEGGREKGEGRREKGEGREEMWAAKDGSQVVPVDEGDEQCADHPTARRNSLLSFLPSPFSPRPSPLAPLPSAPRHNAIRVSFLSWSVILAITASFGWYGLGWLMHESQLEVGVGAPFGGLYWLMTLVLPGYGWFRYPAKLLVVAALGLSALAAIGWDRAFKQSPDRVRRCLLWLAGLSLLGLTAAVTVRPFWDGWLAGVDPDVLFGPLDVAAAFRDLVGAFVQTSLLCGVFWWLLRRGRWPSSSRLVPMTALILVTVDLALANGWMVVCAPGRLWEEKSKLATAIEEFQRRESSGDEPCRVYRHPIWMRPQWKTTRSPTRLADSVRWDHDTLWPKYHLADRIAITEVSGTMKLGDYGQWLQQGGNHRKPAGYVILPDKKVIAGGRRIEVDVKDASLWHNVDHLPRARIEETGRPCRIAHYDPLRVEIEAELSEPGTVVLADQFYPGWQLAVETAGEGLLSKEIRRAGAVMRGVSLPAGSHRLIYRYRPASFLWGAIISGLGWMVLLMWMGVRGGPGMAFRFSVGGDSSRR